MKVCEAAGLAVPGVWPLMFPGNGYHGQVNWLGSLVGCMGQKAYSALLSASKEGEVNLPQHVAVRLSSGQVVEIGPNLTVPNTQKLSKKMPNLSICLGEVTVKVNHKSCENVDSGLNQPGGDFQSNICHLFICSFSENLSQEKNELKTLLAFVLFCLD